MTTLGLICGLAAGMWIGYRLGRRASAPAPSWQSRTRRSALGRQAITLVALVTASQLQRSVQRRVRQAHQRASPLTRPALLARESVRELLRL